MRGQFSAQHPQRGDPNRMRGCNFRAFSAGSQPAGMVDPYAIELLERLGYETGGLRSKSWDEFSRPESPMMDYVITVCSNAVGEVCPLWPGKPATAHWDIPDPAVVDGTTSEKQEAFAQTYHTLEGRIQTWINQLSKDS